jgi:hypothetical protein
MRRRVTTGGRAVWSDERETGQRREEGRACGEGREVIINLGEVERADVCPLFRGLACNTRGTNGETPTSMLGCTQASIEHGAARRRSMGTES